MADLAILFFGPLRDRLGRDVERIDRPSHVLTVDDLLTYLADRGEPYASALSDHGGIRAAIDREHSALGDSLFGAAEVALFPPPSAT